MDFIIIIKSMLLFSQILIALIVYNSEIVTTNKSDNNKIATADKFTLLKNARILQKKHFTI